MSLILLFGILFSTTIISTFTWTDQGAQRPTIRLVARSVQGYLLACNPHVLAQSMLFLTPVISSLEEVHCGLSYYLTMFL